MIRPSDSSGARKASITSLEKLCDDMRRSLRKEVTVGMDAHEDIVDAAATAVYDGYDGCWEGPGLRELASQLLPGILAEHAQRQETWPDTTDCDRLDAAFAALNRAGILSRHHFTCCRRCGYHAIDEIIDRKRQQGHAIRGFVFYHMQRTEAAAGGGSLYLNYGSATDGESGLAVGQEVVECLRGHGLDVEWPQDAEVAIKVKLDWKRRRPPRDMLG